MVKVVEKRLTDRELLVSALPATLIQVAFFVVPLAMIILLTFQTAKFYRLAWTWDFVTWQDVFSHAYYWRVLLNTVINAAICVVVSLVVAFPFAYALATRLKAFENHIKVLIIFAFLTDLVLKTYGWALFLDKYGVLNWMLKSVGIVGPDFDHGLIFMPAATIIGMVYNLLPFMIFTIYLSILTVDRDLIDAAYDAGASKFRAFWEVTLPLCRPGIWAGSVLVFVLSLGVFLEQKILGGGKSPLMGELIHQTFGTRINWPLGAALTVVVILAGTMIVLTFSRFYRLQKYALR